MPSMPEALLLRAFLQTNREGYVIFSAEALDFSALACYNNQALVFAAVAEQADAHV